MSNAFVELTNPKTGEMKQIKVGFSWVLFLFSGFFGIPLFLRKLWLWGGIMIAVWIWQLGQSAYLKSIAEEAAAKQALAMMLEVEAPADVGFTYLAVIFGNMLTSIVIIILSIVIGRNGNKLTALKLLEDGWRWSNTESESTKNAKRIWNLER